MTTYWVKMRVSGGELICEVLFRDGSAGGDPRHMHYDWTSAASSHADREAPGPVVDAAIEAYDADNP